MRTSDEPNFLSEEDLRGETGNVSDDEIKEAMNLKKITEKAKKEYDKQMRKVSKDELKEMAEIMDRILAEGVENLESPSGRRKFLENLKKMNFKTRESEIMSNIEETMPKMEKLVAQEVNEFVHQIICFEKLDVEGNNDIEEMTLLLLPNGVNKETNLGELWR